MDFQTFGEDTLKIKSKKVNLAIDPREKISKFDAEAVLLTEGVFDASRINDYRVIIDGPGEYEVSGLKISGIKSDGGIIYELISDNTNILVAKASVLEKIPTDKLDDYKIVVINVDSELNQSVIIAMEPRVVILYGQNKKEGAKKIGSESIPVSSKISLSEDKLPEELEVMLLG
jgi:hypothetical protein